MAETIIESTRYMKDARGALVPVDVVHPIDKLRDETVDAVFADIEQFREQQRKFVARVNQRIGDFLDLEAQHYGAPRTDWKGNLRLTSYDGLRRVNRVISDRIEMGEQLQIAVQLINELINDLAEGARPELIALLKRALRTDEEGKYNTGELLGLRSLAIEDERWTRAMEAINDAITVQGIKVAVRFGMRAAPNGKFESLSLELSSLWD